MGGSNSNDTDHKIVVQDLGALRSVWCAPLDEGTEATVLGADSERWVLHKNRADLVPDQIFIVSPLAGAPSAGAAGARWLKDVSCGIDQAVQVPLSTDESTSSNTPVLIPGMIVDIVAAPAPVGGSLLIDFSGVFGVGNNTNTGLITASIYLFVNNIQVAVATFTENVTALEVVSIKTVSMTKLYAVPQGDNTVEVRWSVNGPAGSTLLSDPISDSDVYFANLRIVEICSQAA